MSKFEKITIVIVVTMLAYTTSIKGQLPHNDSGWIINTANSEEFNSALNFTTKWHPQWSFGSNSGSAELNYPVNLIETGTTLKIKADTLIPSVYDPNPIYDRTYVYQSGAMVSRQQPYNLGYIEISAKYPSGMPSLWPAFWLWMSDCDNTPYYYDEIDIAENAGQVSLDGNMVATNAWLHCPYGYNIGTLETDLDFNVSSGFNRYAVEWDPTRIIWYVNEIPIRTIYDPTHYDVPQYPMKVILNLALHPDFIFLPTDWNHNNNPYSPTTWPQYFEIDYLRYYQLETETDCNTALAGICNPGDYDRAVKQYITTHASCTPTFNPTTFAGSYTLRATDHVTLNDGVIISPTGSGYFAIQTIECPQ